MDFKGITWAGNIYEKFEAMCLEVEDVMYEDTVKYVENQVQKVGVSVKKFYAEVMQDLLPPSCIDPMEVSAGDLPLKPYAQTGTNKKSKPSIQGIHGELKKKESEDEDVSDLTAEESSLNVRNDANHLSPLSPRGLAVYTHSNVCSTKSKRFGVYKRPIGIKRISKNNHPPQISCAMTSTPGDRSRQLAGDTRSNCSSDDMIVTRPSEFFVRNDPGEAATENTPISDASVESLNSDRILSAESRKQEKNDSKSSSNASDKILSAESLRQKKDDSECNSSCQGLPIEAIDKFKKDDSLSQIKSSIGSNKCEVESVGEEAILSCEDNYDIEVIETQEVLKPRVEIFEPIEKSKLEESCVLVEGDDLHFVSQGTKKHKSYKKKLREALSSKLRSTRKQDQCALRYKDLDEKNDAGVIIAALTMDSDKRKLLSHDTCESEWELL